VRAVEDALNIKIPDNARIIRNLITGIQYVQDHVIHFYHLHALDWVDIVSALKANPKQTAALQKKVSPSWPNSSATYFKAVQDRVKAFVESGQLGPFANAYWGHPAYKLPAEANLMAVAHYLEALEWQRDVIKIQALLGAKNPHAQTYLVGGMSIPVDPDSQNALNAGSIAFIQGLAKKAKEFVEKVYIPDVLAVAPFYLDWAGYGGFGNFMACGEFPNDNENNTENLWLPRGIIINKDLSKVHPLDHVKVTEYVTHSWYEYSGGDSKAKHPWDGETNFKYSGPKPPYDMLDTDKKYSWLKAPRYDDMPMEVGPLARMLVAYGSGHERVQGVVNHVLKALGNLPATVLFSTLGRIAARAVETLVTAEMIPVWLGQLADNMGKGDLRIHSTENWDPAGWPKEVQGYGLHEAPRGCLGHWVKIKDGKIDNYQCVVPSTWNGSPRDAKGQKGPYEASLIGTPVADINKPVEILRTIHSFDPCMACAVHVTDPEGKEVIKIKVV
jgi:[NiFe] hydrogenase large subunit/hydrogenase large subunit